MLLCTRDCLRSGRASMASGYLAKPCAALRYFPLLGWESSDCRKNSTVAAGFREELSRQDVRRESASRRAAIEGTNSALKRSQGVGKLKVRGIVKCSMQIAFKVIGHNIKQ